MEDNRPSREFRQQRLRNALWGLFIGDALAMPAHWFYNIGNISDVFDGGIRGYVDPPHPHPESFMVGMTYRPIQIRQPAWDGLTIFCMSMSAITKPATATWTSEVRTGRANTAIRFPDWMSAIITTTD